MNTYEVKLVRRDEIAEGTMAFYFEKPASFSYRAGQYAEVTLIDPPESDAEGPNRAFSIAAAPHESELMIASRMRDTAFKRVLRTMPLGTAVRWEAPIGSFTLHTDAAKPAVFLMGGIGVTPARAMILDAIERKLPHSLTLFYSNRRPEDAAFLAELQRAESQSPTFKLVATMTDMAGAKQPWSGETGYIDTAMVQRHVADPTAPIWYLAGPAAMVGAMRALAAKLGVNEDNIRTEEFSGY
ncbi:FAD-dependent oxidoreductase [Candidatus Parcubacteria bacterium]|nr:MAG: FAD-dependent oxidoreductase [Candidatus Parcubacteria bacterium]